MARKTALIVAALTALALAAAMLAGCGDGNDTEDGTVDPGGTGKASIIEFSQPG